MVHISVDIREVFNLLMLAAIEYLSINLNISKLLLDNNLITMLNVENRINL